MSSRLFASRRAGVFASPLWTAALLTVALSITATSSHAMRHLKLNKSFPTKDTTVTVSPAAIKLWLSEPADLAASSIKLRNVTGTPVALAKLSHDSIKDAPLEAKLVKPIAPGMYVVDWKAMSKDGHVVKGVFGFRVAMALGAK